MQTVPYKGTAPAMNDLLGGQVDLMCDQTTNTTGQIAAKRSRPTPVTTTKRPDDAGAEGPADARRSRPEGLQRVHLARPLRAQGHAEGGVDKINAALKVALKDAGLRSSARKRSAR
jgi:tripartite-type tricarboxylate transporter receptor subunit TctC